MKLWLVDSNRKGNVAELKIAAAAADLGVGVLRPVTEHERYDLVFDVDGQLLRVQCKWGTLKDGVIRAHLAGSRVSPTRGYVRSTYDSSEIDMIAIYVQALDRCYVVPVDAIDARTALCLRIDPPRNGQRGAINWAVDYELGAVAQLAERYRGTVEARGSNPLSSIPSSADTEAVGAHQFRNHFGWYAQRAAAGETFHITRRGAPFVTLGPPGEEIPDRPASSPRAIRLPLVTIAGVTP